MQAQMLWCETAMEDGVDFEVGQSFVTFDSLEASLLRWQDSHYVQLYKRDSQSVVAARKHCTKRHFSDAIKFASVKYACIHGRRQHKSV